MAIEPNTLAEVLDQIKQRFPRHNAAFDAYATSNIESWLDHLTRLFPWWFFTTNAGTLLRSSFPIASLASVTLKAGSWADLGWLITTAGTQVYDIYTVASEANYYTSPSDATLWHLAMCQEVRYVYEFDANGSFLQDLDVQDDVSALTFMGYQTRQRPVQVMWRTLENRSQLVFDPIPDDRYLYAVSFTQSSSPMYTRDSGVTYNHKWLTYCPEAVVQYGIMKAAQYFDEPGLAKQAEKELMGEPANIHLPRSKKPYLGLLDVLRNDTIKKQQQFELEKLQIFNSKSGASGRGGSGNNLTMHQKYFSPNWRRGIF